MPVSSRYTSLSLCIAPILLIYSSTFCLSCSLYVVFFFLRIANFLQSFAYGSLGTRKYSGDFMKVSVWMIFEIFDENLWVYLFEIFVHEVCCRGSLPSQAYLSNATIQSVLRCRFSCLRHMCIRQACI